MGRVRASSWPARALVDLFAGEAGAPDLAYLPVTNESVEGGKDVFYGSIRVRPVLLVEVYVIDAQPL